MIYIFISVFIVLAIMNVFMMLILHQMVKSTGKQIEKDAGRMLAVYDELIEKKSQILNELENKEQDFNSNNDLTKDVVSFSSKEDKKEGHNTSVSLRAVPFHDSTYSSAYKRIKEGFTVDCESLAKEFIDNLSEDNLEEEEYRNSLVKLLDIFSFENTYQLSLLERDKAEIILKDILNSNEYEIYLSWINKSKTKNIIEFRDWLKLEYDKTDNLIKLRVPASSLSTAESDNSEGRIKYEEDSSICEGAKIIYKNKLYDYSI